MEDKKITNELNLIDILIAIWKWIVGAVKTVFRFLGEVLQLLYRNIVLTICLLVVAFAISQYFARQSNRQYKAGAMAMLHGVQASTVKQIGDQLHASSPRFEVTSLGRKLGLPDSIAKKIGNINFYDVIDYRRDSVPDVVDFARNHSLSDTMNVVMKDYIYIQMTIQGTNHVEEVGDAILKFINDNPVVQNDFEVSKDNLRQTILISEIETKRLDSLAQKKYFEEDKANIKFQNNQLLIGNQMTQLLYGDMLFLQRVKSQAQTKLAESKAPVIVPSGFILHPKAINGRMTNGIKGLFVGLVISVLLAFIIENYKKWIAFLKKGNQ